jgi:uncharacterized membrane protein YcaP (DUF421 family)
MIQLGSDILDVVLRTATVYLVIVFGLLLLGKKELSQISVTDLVFILLISNAVQNAMVGENTTLGGGLVAAGVLFLLNFTFRRLNYSSKTLRKVIQGEPVLLIYEGNLNERNLKKESITEEELMAALREHGVDRIEEVKLAMLEIDGNISVVSKDFVNRTKHKKQVKGLFKN